MLKVLLCSEDFIKTNSSLNSNTFGNYLTVAIKEAQDINLQSIVGETLYKTLLSMVGDGSITASTNVAYKALLDDYIQPYLLYQVQSNLIPLINIKLGNIGSVVSNDEHIQTLSQGNVDLVHHYFEQKADFYARRMQEYLVNNADEYELDECTCESLRANLRSAASTGLWLGGLRNNGSLTKK